MPAKAVSAATMQIGKKGGGKHWTAEQVAAREAAASQFKRIEVSISPPEWLSSGALVTWDRVVIDAAALGNGELLDNLDIDMLAIYCDAVDKVQTLNNGIVEMTARKFADDVDIKLIIAWRETIDDEMKMLQGWYRIIATCADKLGFTPQARARLIKHRADNPGKDKFGAEFDD